MQTHAVVQTSTSTSMASNSANCNCQIRMLHVTSCKFHEFPTLVGCGFEFELAAAQGGENAAQLETDSIRYVTSILIRQTFPLINTASIYFLFFLCFNRSVSMITTEQQNATITCGVYNQMKAIQQFSISLHFIL